MSEQDIEPAAVSRQQLEERERQVLAPWAMPSAESRGRCHREAEATYRTCYQRDRDRIIHCKAFRRLEYKTQVFLNHEGDHYRTRLTHTMEVAQIARSIARALGLNEDLTEAVALAHDVGHTPFGHSGERALRELMAEHGGFEHNEHGLRVVDLLEQQYRDFPGLNLTHEVRECIVKHKTRWDAPQVEEFGPGPAPLEGQVVEVADSIAYDNHDLQDGLEAGILAPSRLQELALWREAEQARGGPVPAGDPAAAKEMIRYLIDRFVKDAVRASGRAIREHQVGAWRDAIGLERNLIAHGGKLQELKSELEDFLYDSLYMDHRVIRVTNSAQRFVEKIFEAYVSDPRQLPPEYRRWADEVGLHRAVCDYVAGMTDRFAQDTYSQLYQPYQRL